MSLKGISIFSSGGHFVKPRTTISAYLVEGHPRNISVKLIDKRAMMALGGLPEYHWNQIVLFIALAVVLFNGAKRFKQLL